MNEMPEAAGLRRAPATGVVTRERAAVSLMFLANGYIFGNWAPKIPDFAARLNLDSAAMGLLLLVFGLGSLSFMPAAGALATRYGSGAVTRGLAVAAVPSLLLVTLAPNVATAAVAMFYFGGALAAMDVSMNANAVAVERSMRRAIMSSCHAFWSLGGLIGASTAGFLMTRFGVLAHVIVVTVMAAAMTALAWTSVLPDMERHGGARKKFRLPLKPLPWLVGIVALFSMIPEGAILDWGAYHMKQDLGASVELAGLGLAAFSLTMSAMRFAGDLVRDRLGAVLTMRLCAFCAMAGLLTVGLAGDPRVAIAGFALCGVGISNLVPIAISMAGNLPGVAAGAAVSLTTMLGYSGILVAPSLIGFVAKHSGFGVVFATLPLLLLVVLAASGFARYADRG